MAGQPPPCYGTLNVCLWCFFIFVAPRNPLSRPHLSLSSIQCFGAYMRFKCLMIPRAMTWTVRTFHITHHKRFCIFTYYMNGWFCMGSIGIGIPFRHMDPMGNGWFNEVWCVVTQLWVTIGHQFKGGKPSTQQRVLSVHTAHRDWYIYLHLPHKSTKHR